MERMIEINKEVVRHNCWVNGIDIENNFFCIDGPKAQCGKCIRDMRDLTKGLRPQNNSLTPYMNCDTV